MILSASRRTDIPCYYTEWFMNRIRSGFVLIRNPWNHAQVSHVPLTPDVVDCIVFWTKDAKNILADLDELDRCGYKYYFQFTLTPYGRSLERNLRPKEEIADTFAGLSKRIGRDRVVWRYDPIILNDTLTVSYHMEQFRKMCGKLSAYTDTVTVSFVDQYARRSAPFLRPFTQNEIAELSGFIGKTAREYGLRAAACCENYDLSGFGIEPASCIDPVRIAKICGCPMDLYPDKNQREGCGCCESIDIGAYNTCMNGCVYCYANHAPETTKRRFAAHDPQSGLLSGSVSVGGGKIFLKKVKTNKSRQGKQE